MEYQSSDRVIVYGGAKELMGAAIYFDAVLPVSFSSIPESLHSKFKTPEGQEAFLYHKDQILMCLRAFGYEDIIEEYESLRGITWHADAIKTFYRPKPGYEEEVNRVLIDEIKSNREIRVPHHFAYRNESKCWFSDDTARFSDHLLKFNWLDRPAPILATTTHIANGTETLDTLSLTLVNIEAVDVNNASWEQIAELRNDTASLAKLRNLRLFMFEKWRGKDLGYVVDDLSRRREQYALAATKHGFTVQQAILKAVLNSKHVVLGCCAGALSMALGDATIAAGIGSAALAGGIAVELGNVLLDVRKERFDFRQSSDLHDLAYLIETNERLKK